MPIISGIEENRGRVDILVDGVIALRVRKAHFDKCPLSAGDEIDIDAYTDRLAGIQFPEAYEAALTSLDNAAHAEKEIAQSLRRRGFVEPVVDAVLQKLRENGLVDDARFALRMAELHARRPVGVYAFRQKLRSKGITEDAAEDALSVFDDEQQRKACLEAAQSLYRKYAGLPAYQARGKLSQALARRGFPWDAIQDAVDQLLEEED
ncbi:MAG: RecX family transcriptional regulator [Clostridia bacterium]|nr:RecX family transcriptional regulator [Clostridia bacterium]